MNDEPPSQLPASEAATRAPAPSAGATASMPPGPPSEAAGRPPADAAPAELRDHPRYRVLALIGQGGMGAVYKAEHRHMGRVVALKVISPALVGSEAAVARFRQEVQAAARLIHPNIVTAYDADQAGGLHFLVMEFIDGESLDAYLRQKGALPVAEACDYARQAALGLQHAHEMGMVHRDVKPHNLMRTPDGRIKILDFGLARLGRVEDALGGLAGAPASAQLTAVGAVMGTPDYMAPEQAGDASSADIRADIYSLGCTLYQTLSGRVPFPDGAAVDKLMRHTTEASADLAGLRPGLPAGVVAIVRKMMAKDPAGRFRTPGEVAAALAPFAVPRRRGRRLAAVTIAVAVGVLALLGGLAVNALTRTPVAPDRGVSRPGPAEPPAANTGPKPVKPPRPPLVQRVPGQYQEGIRKGLAYLARTQKEDGHWEATDRRHNTAVTALAGMALLMDGSTLEDGEHADAILKATRWLLVQRSQPSGLLGDPPGAANDLYLFGHGYATLFLATVYGKVEDDALRHKLERVLTKAVEFTADAQSSHGGWGYIRAAEGNNFDEGASTVVQLQGLRAARNAGIVVPKKLIDMDYLRQCTTPTGGVIYSLSVGGGDGRPALTAAALAGMYTAGDYDSELASKWLKYCRQTIPTYNPNLELGHNEYMQYYYAQALYILGDTGYEKLFPGSKPEERLTWSKYREAAFGAILSNQAGDGGWNGRAIGPVYATACYLTILQLDNEAVPIYRR
jgi:hypothetical protein